MGDVNIGTGHAVAEEQFMNTAFQQYVDKLICKPYMGTTTEYPIQVNEDLQKGKGDTITFNLAGALDGDGVEGSATLEGNEEEQDFYGHPVTVNQKRNAVCVPLMSENRAAFDVLAQARPALTTWLAQKVEQTIFNQLSSINGVLYSAATEAQKDQWLDDNEDRVLFGDSTSNLDQSGGSGASGNDHSDSLLTIDSTNDILDTEQISLAKRLAQLCNPKIRPIKIENGEEYYVMFVHNLCARDLKNTDAWKQAQREAMPRSTENPIFTGMIGVWDGVIIKESPKVTLLSGVGASTINVAVNTLLGAQAILFAQGKTRKGYAVDMVEEEFDYDDKIGVAIRSVFGIEKARFITNDTNPVQHGVVTVYSAAVAD